MPDKIDIVNVFRAPDALPGIAEEAVAIGAAALWCQFGVINVEAAQIATDGGVTVIMDRCLKVEHARYVGRMHWLGFQHPADHRRPRRPPVVAAPAATTSRPLAEIRLLLFDVMGTVVDLDGTAHRTAVEVLAPTLSPDQARAAVQTWERELGVRMDAVLADTASWRPHAELRAEALRAALSPQVASELSAEAWSRLDDVVRQADPWPEAPAALARLRELRTCVALSNAGVGELASLSRHGGLGWHAVVSAESARSFKPDPGVYQTANRLLGVPPEQTMLVAAHPWDLRAAAEQGMATAYVARPDAEPPAPDDHFSVEVEDLHELATLLDRGSTDHIRS